MYLRFVIGPGVGRLSCPRFAIAVSKSICSSTLAEKSETTYNSSENEQYLK